MKTQQIQKAIAMILVLTSILAMLVSCGSIGNMNKKSDSKNKGKVRIEDIAWEYGTMVEFGDKNVVLEYENNSDFIISGLVLHFAERKDITDEEKMDIAHKMIAHFGFDDTSEEDINDFMSEPLGMRAESKRTVLPGESVNNARCYYYDGYYYVQDFDYVDYVEPDYAIIKYVEDGRIYTETYDYQTKKYRVEDETEDAEYWSDSVLATLVPKPDTPVIKKSGYGSSNDFRFEAFHISKTDFEAYVGTVSTGRFSVDAYQRDDYYSAEDEHGFKVIIDYDNSSASMEVEVRNAG